MDDRGRVAVPAKLMPSFRELAGSGEKESVEVIVCVTPDKRVGVFPRKVFMEMMEEMEKPAKVDRAIAKLRKAYLNHMDQQSLDKQNRIRIPAIMAEAFGLSGEVVVMGCGEFLEIVTREEWRRKLFEDTDTMDAGEAMLAAWRRQQEERD